MLQSFKEKSKENYGREFCGDKNQVVTWQEVRDGCLMRIADAAEKMALNHAKLIEERDRFERLYREERASSEHLWRQACALRGVITKLKKKGETKP